VNLDNDWDAIRHVFAPAFYASIATVGADGLPHVTPIGSLILHREAGSGFWFEVFSATMPRNLDRQPRLCAMAVDTRLRLWGRALLSGRFPAAPGIRLTGVAGARRPATEREIQLFRRRVRAARWTRGYQLLWRDFAWGREVTFDRVLPIRLGRMWPPQAIPSSAIPGSPSSQAAPPAP
jgi:uncharacterized protein